MNEERAIHINSVIERLVMLTTSERTTALTHLFNLRTAAVEDLTDLDDNRRHWDTVLSSPVPPNNVRDLVGDLTQLTDEELATVSVRVSEWSSAAHSRVLQTADEEERARLQAQLAASAKKAHQSYVAAQRGLSMQHKTKLAEKMKDVRDAIEHGVNSNQDVTLLEEIFTRIEQDFWDQYHASDELPVEMEQ